MHILKRAQILVADLWACFEGQGLGAFTDIDTITMFADYRCAAPALARHTIVVWLTSIVVLSSVGGGWPAASECHKYAGAVITIQCRRLVLTSLIGLNDE